MMGRCDRAAAASAGCVGDAPFCSAPGAAELVVDCSGEAILLWVFLIFGLCYESAAKQYGESMGIKRLFYTYTYSGGKK